MGLSLSLSLSLSHTHTHTHTHTKQVCADQKTQVIFIALVAVIPGLYCLWVSWTLYDVLKDNSDSLLHRAGYDQACKKK